MVSDVSKLQTALENVIKLRKTQLTKELIAAVRLSQGTTRASWKVDKAPNWWSEGEIINAHNAAGTINRFGPIKGTPVPDLQAALVMFYSSRLYYESHLKNRLSEAEVKEVADGNNPFPAKKYEGKNKNMSIAAAEDVDEEIRLDDEDEVKEDASVVTHEKENEKEVSAEEEEQTDAETNETSSHENEGHADVDVKLEEDNGEPEAEEDDLFDVEADTSSTAEEQGDSGGGVRSESRVDPDSDVPQLLKFIAKWKKRSVKERFDALHKRWSDALETRTRRAEDSQEQKVYLIVLSIEMANAKALVNMEEEKMKNMEQMHLALIKIDNEVKKQQISLPPKIRNMKLSQFQELGGTVEKAMDELGKRQTQDAVVHTAIAQSARKTRRTARKPPITFQTPAAAPITALRRSRRTAAQASSIRTRAILEGTPMRRSGATELLLYSTEFGEFSSLNGSPVEVSQVPAVRRTTRATRPGLPPVAPVPIADALSTQLKSNPESLQEILLETARKQNDPDGFRNLLLATAQKVPARRSRR